MKLKLSRLLKLVNLDFAMAGFYSSSMRSVQILPPPGEPGTFLGFPLCLDSSQLEADIAILGIPYGDPYGVAQVCNDQSRAPAAIRRESHGLAGKGRFIGMDIMEITPGRDLNGITCITAGQLILNFIGVTARAIHR
jgi:hypothetical protein